MIFMAFMAFMAIVVAAIIANVLIQFSVKEDGVLEMLSGVVGFIVAVGVVISALMYPCVIWDWVSADYKVQIINREYGTNYTKKEVFFASDVIETIRKLDRKRYEINGDLMRENEKP